MGKIAALHVAACVVCQTIRVPRAPPRIPAPNTQADHPHERLEIDFLSAPEASLKLFNSNGRDQDVYITYTKILVVVDSLTRFAWFIPMQTESAEDTVTALIDRVFMYGIPQQIVCDNGRAFISSVFQESMRRMGVTIRYGPVASPQNQGAVERANSSVSAYLRVLVDETGTDWPSVLSHANLLYNARARYTHAGGFTSSFLYLGRDPLLPIDLSVAARPEETHPLGPSEAGRPRAAPYLERNSEVARVKLISEALTAARLLTLEWHYGLQKGYKPLWSAGDTELKPGHYCFVRTVPVPGQHRAFQAKFQGPYVIMAVTPQTVTTRDRYGALCTLNKTRVRPAIINDHVLYRNSAHDLRFQDEVNRGAFGPDGEPRRAERPNAEAARQRILEETNQLLADAGDDRFYMDELSQLHPGRFDAPLDVLPPPPPSAELRGDLFGGTWRDRVPYDETKFPLFGSLVDCKMDSDMLQRIGHDSSVYWRVRPVHGADDGSDDTWHTDATLYQLGRLVYEHLLSTYEVPDDNVNVRRFVERYWRTEPARTFRNERVPVPRKGRPPGRRSAGAKTQPRPPRAPKSGAKTKAGPAPRSIKMKPAPRVSGKAGPAPRAGSKASASPAAAPKTRTRSSRRSSSQ